MTTFEYSEKPSEYRYHPTSTDPIGQLIDRAWTRMNMADKFDRFPENKNAFDFKDGGLIKQQHVVGWPVSKETVKGEFWFLNGVHYEMYQHGDRMDDVLSTDDLDYIDIDKLSSMDEFLRATESLEGKDKWTTCRVKSEDIDRVYLALAYKLWNENVANVKMALEIVLRDDGQKAKQERLLKSSKMNRKNTQENSTLFWGNHPEWIFQYNNGNFGFIFTGDNYFSLQVDMKEGQSVLFPLVVFDEKDPRYNDYDYYTLHRGEEVFGTKHGLNIWVHEYPYEYSMEINSVCLRTEEIDNMKNSFYKSKPHEKNGGPYAEPPKSVKDVFTNGVFTDGVLKDDDTTRLTTGTDPAIFLLDKVLDSLGPGYLALYTREYLNCLCDPTFFKTFIVDRNDKKNRSTPLWKESKVDGADGEKVHETRKSFTLILDKNHDMKLRTFLDIKEQNSINSYSKRPAKNILDKRIIRTLCRHVRKMLNNAEKKDVWVELQLLRYANKGKFDEHGDGVCDFSDDVFRNFPVRYENEKTYEENRKIISRERFAKTAKPTLTKMDNNAFYMGRRLATFFTLLKKPERGGRTIFTKLKHPPLKTLGPSPSNSSPSAKKKKIQRKATLGKRKSPSNSSVSKKKKTDERTHGFLVQNAFREEDLKEILSGNRVVAFGTKTRRMEQDCSLEKLHEVSLKPMNMFDPDAPFTTRDGNKVDYKMSSRFVDCLPKHFKETFEKIKNQIPNKMITCQEVKNKLKFREAKVDWHFMVTNPGGEDQGLHADHAKKPCYATILIPLTDDADHKAGGTYFQDSLPVYDYESMNKDPKRTPRQTAY